MLQDYLSKIPEYCAAYEAASSPWPQDNVKNPKQFHAGRESIPTDHSGSANLFTETITPGSNDLSDYFYWLSALSGSDSDNSQEKNTAIRALRKTLGLPETDPDKVRLEFAMHDTQKAGLIATTKIIPENYDATLAPIVFATGLSHRTAVYLDFLVKLSRETGRKIIAFDSPGVGASHYSENTISMEILSNSFTEVIRSEVPPNQSIVLMGHSMGTMGLRDLIYHEEILNQDIIPNPVEKYIPMMPPSWGKDQRHGIVFSKKFMLAGAQSMLVNRNRLVPQENDGLNFYFQLHETNDREWLENLVYRDSLKANPIAYLKVLGTIGHESLWDHLPNKKILPVFADQDQIVRLKKAEEWSDRGAIVLKNADHSCIAGQNVNPGIVNSIAKTLAGE